MNQSTGWRISSHYATTGSGIYQINSGATLEIGASTSDNVMFLHNAILELDKGIGEGGFLQNFSTGDSVDQIGVTVTSLSESNKS